MNERFWAVSGAISFAILLASSYSIAENVNIKLHGNCLLWTIVDEFTDEEAHMLACHDKEPDISPLLNIEQLALSWLESESPVVVLGWKYGKTVVVFRNDKLKVPAEKGTVDVKYRVGKGDVRVEEWEWDFWQNNAITESQSAFDHIVMELPANGRIVFEVDGNRDNRTTITLTEPVSVVRDFHSRIDKADQ